MLNKTVKAIIIELFMENVGLLRGIIIYIGNKNEGKNLNTYNFLDVHLPC